jgi:Ca2+-binding EF-hand superfamily protein
MVLTSCAGDQTKERGGRSHSDPFLKADHDGDGALNYPEFRHYANLEAKGQGADAMNRRAAEQMAGNRELHKRFIFLDLNNDGRVSESEMSQ